MRETTCALFSGGLASSVESFAVAVSAAAGAPDFALADGLMGLEDGFGAIGGGVRQRRRARPPRKQSWENFFRVASRSYPATENGQRLAANSLVNSHHCSSRPNGKLFSSRLMSDCSVVPAAALNNLPAPSDGCNVPRAR